MGMKSTIGICYDGKMIDVTWYSGCSNGCVLLQAFILYGKYRNCKTPQMYMKRKIAEYKRQDPEYVYNKKDWKESIELGMMISESHLNIDFTHHCIYYGREIKSMEELIRYPDSKTMMSTLSRKQQYEFTEQYLTYFIENSVFWLKELDFEEVLRLSYFPYSVYSKYFY